MVFANGPDGDVDKSLQTRVVPAQGIAVAVNRQVDETLKAHETVERAIDAVVGAVQIVQINVSLTEGGSGDGLVMIGVDAKVCPRKALFQLCTVFAGDRYAQTRKIGGRMPRFGATLEQCQPVPGVGNA
ncbi:hypothetical protein D3C77_575130 [compost metagenome]